MRSKQSEQLRIWNEVLDVLSRHSLWLPCDNREEAAEDYRIAEARDYQERIKKLRRALSDGKSTKYEIAHLALGVGFGAAAPAVHRARLVRLNSVKRGKSKAGKTKAKPEQIAALLARLKVTTGPSYHERVRRACNKSGWPLSISTAERTGKRNGLK